MYPLITEGLVGFGHGERPWDHFSRRNGILLLVIILSGKTRQICGLQVPTQSQEMQQLFEVVLHGLRLVKDSISKVIVTNDSVCPRRSYMYVSGKCEEMSIILPDTTSSQILRELSTKPDVNNWYMFLKPVDRRRSRKLSILIDDYNTVQPGRSSGLAAGSEARQLLHKHSGGITVQKPESLQRGKK